VIVAAGDRPIVRACRENGMTKATPFLMFQHGKAEAALDFYVATVPGSRIVSVERFGPEGPGPKGSILRAYAEIAGQPMMAHDSFITHGFDFTPSFSFFLDCVDDAEIGRLFATLGEGGSQAGWPGCARLLGAACGVREGGGAAGGFPLRLLAVLHPQHRNLDLASTDLANELRRVEMQEIIATHFLNRNDSLATVLRHEQESRAASDLDQFSIRAVVRAFAHSAHVSYSPSIDRAFVSPRSQL
jgi:predicted 3-demethylubiquinone-9 3-methyltransferase (glyoxalase superfamily)